MASAPQAGSDQDVYETLEAALQAKTCILSNPAAGTFVSTDVMNITAAGYGQAFESGLLLTLTSIQQFIAEECFHE